MPPNSGSPQMQIHLVSKKTNEFFRDHSQSSCLEPIWVLPCLLSWKMKKLTIELVLWKIQLAADRVAQKDETVKITSISWTLESSKGCLHQLYRWLVRSSKFSTRWANHCLFRFVIFVAHITPICFPLRCKRDCTLFSIVIHPIPPLSSFLSIINSLVVWSNEFNLVSRPSSTSVK